MVSGTLLTITIGLGGANATTYPGAASDGGNTIVSGASPFYTVTALGGKGAFTSSPGYPKAYILTGHSYVQYEGQAGDANTFTYAQKNSTTYAIIRKFGDGGAAGPDYNRRSQGETRSFNESNGVTTLDVNNSTVAPEPGGGGGGGYYGEDGGRGKVIIRY